MQHPALLGELDRPGHGLHQPGCFPRRKGPLAQFMRQAVPRHKFHAVKMLSLKFSHLMDGNDVMVLQPGRRRRLGPKTGNVGGAGQRAGPNEFDRDDAVQAALTGFENDAHAAMADFLNQLVITQFPKGKRRSGAIRQNKVNCCWRIQLQWFSRRPGGKRMTQNATGTKTARRAGRQ